MFEIGHRIRRRLDQARQRRDRRRAQQEAVAARVRSIADAILRNGDKHVENERHRGSFTGSDLKSMQAEIERLSGGDDQLVLRALDDPRIVTWKRAWADQRNLLPDVELVRINYFASLGMQIQERSNTQDHR